MRTLAKLKRARFLPFDRGDHAADAERRVENTDALAATGATGGKLDPQSGTGHAGAPPGYVKPDDGRPRH